MSKGTAHLRLGTRGSLLARSQSQSIADELVRMHPGLRVELVILKTTGDQILDRPLYDIGGKGLFTKEIEQALINGQIDFAVHSFKDLPVAMPLVDESKLAVAAVPKREDWRDVAVMLDPKKGALPRSARIGTSSLRRRCQILDVSPSAQILPLRGNIDTRIRKLRAAEYDVVILAMAGLKRAGLFDTAFMKPCDLLPAPGQGALAVQCRADDDRTRAMLHALNDPVTRTCVECERAIVRGLDGDCHSPIAALAAVEEQHLVLRARVGWRDGNPPLINAVARAPVCEAARAVTAVLEDLKRQNVEKMLA